MSERTTIAAVATPPGQGGIGVVRLSGPLARHICTTLTGLDPRARYAHYCHFRDKYGAVLDSGITLFFPAPNSFTGEDVVELQAHGGPVILDLLVEACCSLGAQQARAGEFSERAFLNDKLDLTQAEAIADLIASSSRQAALNASRTLQGAFSTRIEQLVKAVTTLRVYIEAAIDFPEEEIDFLADARVTAMLDDVQSMFAAITEETRQGSLLAEGMKIVIAGKPNAGKSSLLNALSGQDTAIVTAIEGTTRDVLRQHIQIDGMPLHVVDTAGLRSSTDVIEMEGIRRARDEIATADRVLLVIDSTRENVAGVDPARLFDEEHALQMADIPITLIDNKCDLTGRAACLDESKTPTIISLSARTGEGIPLLREHLKQQMGYNAGAEGNFSARRRHLNALQEAESFLLSGMDQLRQSGAGELLAEDLRQCQQTLGQITGEFSSDDLLGEIFSSFCIGK